MKKKQISIGTDEGRAMIKLLKRIYDCEDFSVPDCERDEVIAAELIEKKMEYNKMYFAIYNNGASGFDLRLRLAYSKDILCMLHTKKPHRNTDGSLIHGPHLHRYQQGKSHYDAIAFSEYLRDSEEIGACLYDFLSYCGVDNLNDLPIQFELL